MCVPLQKGILCLCLRNEVTLYVLMGRRTIYGTEWRRGGKHHYPTILVCVCTAIMLKVYTTSTVATLVSGLGLKRKVSFFIFEKKMFTIIVS